MFAFRMVVNTREPSKMAKNMVEENIPTLTAVITPENSKKTTFMEKENTCSQTATFTKVVLLHSDSLFVCVCVCV